MFKFDIDDFVRFRKKKAKILSRWKDNAGNIRYELRFVIGKNLVGDIWMTLEDKLKEYVK